MSALPAAFTRLPLAHRAFHDLDKGRPENSRAAIQAAIDAGYGIEIDVQLSADGAAMVFHDDVLDRLTEQSGPVRDRAADDLCQIVLRGGVDGIPTLPEVLAQVGGRVPLLIEIKDQDGAMGPDVGALEQAVAQAVVGYAGPCAVMSFNPHSIAQMQGLVPDVPRGLVTSAYDPKAWWPLPEATCRHLRDIPDYARVGACFVSHEASDLDRPRVAELKALGATVLCWTIRSEAEEARARRVADGITFEGYRAAFPA